MISLLSWRFALILSFLSLNYQIASGKVQYRFQSGTVPTIEDTSIGLKKNDDSFASSLHYDSQNNLLFITGGTYSRFWNGIGSESTDGDINTSQLAKSDCFLTILKVPPHDTKEKNSGGVEREMKTVYAKRFGNEDTPEACAAVMFMPSVGKTARAIALGNTEEGGLLTSLRTPGSRKASMYGFMMDFNIELAKKKGKVVNASGKVEGGKLMYDFPVQYPIAMTTDPLAVPAKEMYTVLLASPFHSEDNQQQDAHKDLTLPDDKIENGQDLRVVIEMTEEKSQATSDYETEGETTEKGVQETIIGGWKKSFSPNLSSISDVMPTLRVSDLVYVPRISNGVRDDVLVLTGTTNGHGPEFGGPETAGNSGHGFVTKFRSIDGDTDPINDGSVATTRVATTRVGATIGATVSATDSEVSVHGICFQKGLVDVEFIYVVGHAKGLLDNTSMQAYQLSRTQDNKISKHAFVAKLRLRTLEQVWSRQIGSQNGEHMIGYGCDVSPDGSTVYLAGTIKDGGKIRFVNDASANSESAGGDDLFVASYSSSGGTNFIKQFGTAEDDTFARGKGIVCDEDGNAIVLGNTRGSMMRLRENNEGKFSIANPSDIFVMSIGKEKGKIPFIAEKFPEMYTGKASINSIPDSDDDNDDNDSDDEQSKTSPRMFRVELFAILTSCSLMLVVIGFAVYKYRTKARGGTMNNISDDDLPDFI